MQHLWDGPRLSARPGGESSSPEEQRAPSSEDSPQLRGPNRGSGAGTARAYSPSVTFQVDELITHPAFGLGIVQAVRRDKVDVAFKASERTLVHGRQAASTVSETSPAKH